MIKLVIKDTFIKDNFDKTIKLVDELIVSDRKKGVREFFDYFADRYASAPASTRNDFHSAFPGGLCFHNLHVYSWILKFANLMSLDVYSKETLFLVSLFHDIGKIGDIGNPYYIETDKRWLREKGVNYETNQKMQTMTVPDRGLFLLQKFGIQLSQEEYLAIKLHDGMYDEANKKYSMHEPKLALILHFSDLWATKLEKDFEIVYD